MKMNGAESDAEKVRFRLVRRGSCQSGTCHPFCVCVCVFEECRELKGVSVWLWWFCFVFRVLRRGEKESSKWYCNHFQELVEKEKEEGHEHDMIWGIVGGFWIRIKGAAVQGTFIIVNLINLLHLISLFGGKFIE